MGHTTDLLDDVRHRIAAHDLVLGETRTRLQLVRDAAISVPGARRTYGSGSLAQHTVNHPVTDGDGGLVLDRRTYPELGPDGGGETPTEVAGKVCELLGPAVRQVYPKARCGTSKRGPKVWFGQSLQGQDPTIDLVVALPRRVGSGLWIPNLEKRTWEASDPERHTDLLNGGPAALRRTRRRVIRLAKAWNKQFAQPGLSSFNISAIALASVQPGLGLAEGLQRFFADGAASLATGRNTPDPAGVSPPLKLLMPRHSLVLDGRPSQSLPRPIPIVLTEIQSGIRTVIESFRDGSFYRMGLRPGRYEATIEREVLAPMGLKADSLSFELAPSRSLEQGAMLSDLRLILRID